MQRLWPRFTLSYAQKLSLVAALPLILAMSVIAILSVLSVMNNKTEVKGEGGNTKINEVKERIFRIFK